MLEAIVLMWIALKLQAPLWVLFVVSLMLVIGIANFILGIIDKILDKRIEKAKKEVRWSRAEIDRLQKWLEEQEKTK